MKASLGIFFATILLLGGCKNTGDNQQDKPADTLKVAEPADLQQHEHDEAIVLDNGKKWKVDANMLSIIRSMESNIRQYDIAKPMPLLIDTLQADIDRLTSNCTMQGQAHDELHKWLIPYIDLVNEATGLTPADALQKLKESFATFNMYFE